MIEAVDILHFLSSSHISNSVCVTSKSCSSSTNVLHKWRAWKIDNNDKDDDEIGDKIKWIGFWGNGYWWEAAIDDDPQN